MATYEPARTAPLGAIYASRLAHVLTGSTSAFQNWNSGRVTRNALSKLSNRELDDIGLCRGDIDMIGR